MNDEDVAQIHNKVLDSYEVMGAYYFTAEFVSSGR